ncbi:hypothetical protein C9J85_19780 [Haloferax sp. wsp5]|nr:hypothetical protein C9J85_19780 [Haloferax sp. wsp5]
MRGTAGNPIIKLRATRAEEVASLAVSQAAVSITLTAVYLRYEASQRSAGGAANPLPAVRPSRRYWTASGRER